MLSRTLYQACPLCDKPMVSVKHTADCSAHALFQPGVSPVMTWLECADCKHIFTDGYHTQAALDLIFSTTHDIQKVGFNFQSQRVISARMIGQVLPFVSSGDWLDVGFGNGVLLMTAQEFGFNPVGLDLRKENVAALNSLKIEAHALDLADFAQPSRFNVLSMCDVLEHFPFPALSLKHAHALLDDQGVLLVSMPNIDSAGWQILDTVGTNPYWGELEHYHNFGKQRLHGLLRECGFEPLSYSVSERYLLGMEIVARKVPKPVVDATGSAPDDATVTAKLKTALAIHQKGQLAEAETLYAEILRTQPRHFEALQLTATIAAQRRQSLLAIELFDQVLRLDPKHASSLNNRACALRELNRHAEALAGFNAAIESKPDYAEAFNGQGDTLRDLCRFEDALVSYQHALRIRPNYAEALNSYGGALCFLNRQAEAIKSFDQALVLKPDYVGAYVNRGNALRWLNYHQAAIDSYARALAISPDYAYLYGAWLHTRMMACDWRDVAQEFSKLAALIEDGKRASVPFPVLAILDKLPLLRKVAEIWVEDRNSASSAPPNLAKFAHDKIRIGYFSADFYDHATANLMAELFERHEKSQFELNAFSFGPNNSGQMRSRLIKAFDHFVDVRSQSDAEVAALARKMEIDIAVDLKGFTQDSREGIFANRAAPIQVNYLGYPGTMSASYMDYLVADRILIPKKSQRHYAEKIVYLPDSYQVNDRQRPVSARNFSRTDLGLPKSGFVFCCFNNSFKITPATFGYWMEILKEVDGSVLWLLEANKEAVKNLRREATASNVDANRLIFAQRMPLDEHLVRQRSADLFLDTLPYNAHTTASDALWVGLPVLTCPGESFASRVAASLLSAIDLPELIVTSPKDYVELAIALATNPQRLAEIRKKLADNRLTTALFDTPLFAKHLEAAFREMHARYQAGKAPDHINVKR